MILRGLYTRSTSRRELIRTGLLGGLTLAFGGWAGSWRAMAAGHAEPLRFLSEDGAALLGAVAPIIIGQGMPVDGAARDRAVAETVRRADRQIAGLPPHLQAEVGQALGLLNFSLTRFLVAGLWSSWGNASAVDIASALENLRTSSLGLKRQLYQFLHEISITGWYGNPASWSVIGYPGPPQVVRPEPRIHS